MKSILIWEGESIKVSRVHLYPSWVFRAPIYIDIDMKQPGKPDRGLAGFVENTINMQKEHEAFLQSILRWKANPFIWDQIKADVKEFEKHRYGGGIKLSPTISKPPSCLGGTGRDVKER